ncbi:hypothetical protein BGX34_008885 [Mortierella sp. NVP85]|nr:hypothetical protein BGX34_008885 [Mortierella sp. NVP85]
MSVQIVYKKKKGVFKNERPNRISAFSSWVLEMKPDMDAPGGYIYSTVPMYAKPGLYKDSNTPDTAARQGAGMINIFDAIRGKALVSPAHLALNDTLHTQETYTITLTNQYETVETFKISNWPAMSILGHTPTTTLVQTLFLTMVTGYVNIEPTLDTSSPVLQVPYAGMHGSYSTIDILDLQEGFPILLGPTPNGRLTPILNRADQSTRTFFHDKQQVCHACS